MGNIITIPENNKKLTKLWLIHSVSALALSGFFAIFLVVARSPEVSKLLPYKDLFKTSLTLHVNLSVLIWLTSFISTIFAAKTKAIKAGFISLKICAAGTILVAISIFDTSAEAYLNNYIPMLDSRIFQIGLWIYFVGFLVASFQGYETNADHKFLRWFSYSSFFIILASFITLLITYSRLNSPENINLYNFADYYDRLFWGFGHMIQFAYVNVLLLALFWIVKEIFDDIQEKFFSKLRNSCFAVNVTLALTGIYIIYSYDVTSYEYTVLYTKQMILFGGVAPIMAFLILLPVVLKNWDNAKEQKPVRNAFLWSLVLFGAGGVISMFIEGSNTIVPAHYHGSIIGISVALMGLCYLLMPKLGYNEIKGRMANLQPVMYGFGQFMHITGFAVSGGYGVMRKTPGMEIPLEAKVYMGLMGIGGLISIIGGLLFVIIILNNQFKK